MLTATPPSSAHAARATTSPLERLQRAIEHAAHFLPAQGPITAFVHHNTLHAFEHLPFEQAVVEGAKTFGCHPYLAEDDYLERLKNGRIRREDLEAVLADDLEDRGNESLGILGTRFQLRMSMLAHPLHTGPVTELKWVVAETDVLRRFRDDTPEATRRQLTEATRRWVMLDLRNGNAAAHHNARAKELVDHIFERFDKPRIESWSEETWEAFGLHFLWLVCRDGIQGVPKSWHEDAAFVRHRDWLREVSGQDCDQLVHETLIPFCAAFLDQGFSGWTLPERNSFFQSFSRLYGGSARMPQAWMSDLAAELNRIEASQMTPLETIQESLELLGVSETEQEEFLTQSLLALRGYAGMLWQVEQRGDRVAHPVAANTLVEFLAVRLILDRLAAAHVAREAIDYRGNAAGIRAAAANKLDQRPRAVAEQRAFLIFQLSQLLGWSPEALYRLTREEWSQLASEIESFSRLERRRIYHLAFERRYRVQALDAVVLRNRRPTISRAASVTPSRRRPTMQVVCCIDEREESFRRHLEEISPHCETFSAAGFFAVAMYYRGAADAQFTPLCPVIIKPKHYVTENVVYTLQSSDEKRRKRRKAIGSVTRHVHVGSRTLTGGWLTAVFGTLASIPLVARILFPRATARLRHRMGGFVKTPAVTRLQLERSEETPGSEDGHVGYSVEEMAVIVERILRDIGLTANFSKLVFICGHGSSSLNNPHEAAHDCGACAGGRGGPNARAFAQMANRTDVREIVARLGITIPVDTLFIGAYHNTCDDSITYYDLHSLLASHRAYFDVAKEMLHEARKRSAHERCRRFESAALNLSTDEALEHVEGRSEDLSQVRPEYGHATNALCFVGHRDWSRDLFLDRRAFLQSYDSTQDDDENTILTRVLQAVIPVCAGISLEYYFSYVDPTGYGCGTKLPHNVTSLLGVMNGAESDLRPGLPWQMVEIHEPVRLLFVIETTPQAMQRIMDRNEGISRLVAGHWVQLATFDPQSAQIHLYRDGAFEPYSVESNELPTVERSIDWYRGWRDHLGFALIQSRTARDKATNHD